MVRFNNVILVLVVVCVAATLKLPWLERAIAQVYGDSGRPFAAVDRVLNEMEWGSVAFNAPQVMNLEDSVVIELLLGLDISVEELKALLEDEGYAEGYEIRVAESMEARLSGPNFSILAITKERQAISSSEPTPWKWEVSPTKVGPQHLHLTLTAFFSVDGDPTPRTIRTFDKIIEIEVTWQQKMGSFLEKNWQWIWAAILVPIGGWAWTKRNKIKKKLQKWLDDSSQDKS